MNAILIENGTIVTYTSTTSTPTRPTTGPSAVRLRRRGGTHEAFTETPGLHYRIPGLNHKIHRNEHMIWPNPGMF
jgi:hypothetical protein